MRWSCWRRAHPTPSAAHPCSYRRKSPRCTPPVAGMTTSTINTPNHSQLHTRIIQHTSIHPPLNSDGHFPSENHANMTVPLRSPGPSGGKRGDAVSHLPSVVLDGEAKLDLERLVSEETVVILVLLVQPAGVVLIRPSDTHATLVVEHGQQPLLLALDEVQTVLLEGKTNQIRRESC